MFNSLGRLLYRMWHKLGLLTTLVAVLTLPVGLLTAMFVGVRPAAVVFIVGWLLLVPLIPILGGLLLHGPEAGEASSEPLTELKRRYASGEIGEEEFARRVERLLETESAERDFEVRAERRVDDADRAVERELE